MVELHPRDGLNVLVRGRLTLYEARGDYQMVLDSMEDAGEGALRRAYDLLLAKLQAEGLFDAQRKRALPAFPRRIAVLDLVLWRGDSRHHQCAAPALSTARRGSAAGARARRHRGRAHPAHVATRADACGRCMTRAVGGGLLEDSVRR